MRSGKTVTLVKKWGGLLPYAGDCTLTALSLDFLPHDASSSLKLLQPLEMEGVSSVKGGLSLSPYVFFYLKKASFQL